MALPVVLDGGQDGGGHLQSTNRSVGWRGRWSLLTCSSSLNESPLLYHSAVRLGSSSFWVSKKSSKDPKPDLLENKHQVTGFMMTVRRGLMVKVHTLH